MAINVLLTDDGAKPDVTYTQMEEIRNKTRYEQRTFADFSGGNE